MKTIDVFTVEEINLLCCCNRESPKALLRDLKKLLTGADDSELRPVIRSAARKLSRLTEEEYGELMGAVLPAEEV
jgi:hypothetical protein